MSKRQKNNAMEITNRRDWINQISDFIGEYTGANSGYSPLALVEILTGKFLISPGEAGKLAGIVAGQ
jgi:hypothetical protein